MLSAVFGAFSFAIVAITWSKGKGTPEPFVLEASERGPLGVLVASGWFKALAHGLLGSWALGPSTEILVALLLVTFFLLVLLLLLGQALRVFFIPLSILTTVIFWQLFSVLKRYYYLENVVELFDRWGLKLRRNLDPLGLHDRELLGEHIALVEKTQSYVLRGQGKSFRLEGFDREKLLEELSQGSYGSWEAVERRILEVLEQSLVVIEPTSSASTLGNTVAWVTSLAPAEFWLTLGIVVVVVLGVILFVAVVSYTQRVSEVQDNVKALAQHSEELHSAEANVLENLIERSTVQKESQQRIIAHCNNLEGRVKILEDQMPKDLGAEPFSYTVLAEGSTQVASQIQGLEQCTEFLVQGDSTAVVVYLLDLSRAQGVIPAERLATIKTAADAVFAIVKGTKGEH